MNPFTIVINFNHSVFHIEEVCKSIDVIGVQAMVNAVIAYLVFDEEFYLQDILDNNPDLHEVIIYVAETIQNDNEYVLTQIRKHYENPSQSHRVHLREKGYFSGASVSIEDGCLFITTTQGQGHDPHLGGWGFPHSST